MQPPGDDKEPNRFAGDGHVRQAPQILAVDPPRSRAATGTGARCARGSRPDQGPFSIIGDIINDKAARNESIRSEGLAHGVDFLSETNASQDLGSTKLSQSQLCVPIDRPERRRRRSAEERSTIAS